MKDLAVLHEVDDVRLGLYLDWEAFLRLEREHQLTGALLRAGCEEFSPKVLQTMLQEALEGYRRSIDGTQAARTTDDVRKLCERIGLWNLGPLCAKVFRTCGRREPAQGAEPAGKGPPTTS